MWTIRGGRVRRGLAAVGVTVALIGCGDETEGDPEPSATRRPALKSVTFNSDPSGKSRFSPRRLTLAAGEYRVVLDNRGGAQHSVRIQKGRTCCFKGEDVGGTETTSEIGKISGTATLEPGQYVYLCTSQWRQGMTGRLTVTK